MKFKFGCTYWGSERLSPSAFAENVLRSGYDGLELFLQPNHQITDEFLVVIDEIKKEKPDFFFILLHLHFPHTKEVKDYIRGMEKNLQFLTNLKPLFINSHTGKDYFSFDDNCRIIDAVMNASAKTGVRILHETHRGRFSFHAATLIPYLKYFPEIELVGDFSHFCTVSESMLEDQEDILSQIIPHVAHIHARIGYEQGPQVGDPSAPECKSHLDIFMKWWEQIIDYRRQKGVDQITITPEFGPPPYMQQIPFAQTPVSDQWNNNLFVLQQLKDKFC